MKERLRRLQTTRADDFEHQWREWSLGGPKPTPTAPMQAGVRDALRAAREMGFK